MSYLRDLITKVDNTHKSLGGLVAILHIAVKARKMVLVVAPSGCGKSTAMSIMAQNTPDSIMPDRLSIAGLATIADKLNSFRSVVVVDDIATTGTSYARQTTITALVALVYTHRIESVMMGIEYAIEDFYGSALIGIQPILLRSIMLLEEWEASIQDKALRYYHLFRPISPNLHLPDVKLNKGIPFDDVEDFEPAIDNLVWRNLLALADSQWSRARAKEHLKDFCKGIASLEDRKNVINDDFVLLLKLLKPMAIENICVVKGQLEGPKNLDNNLLALLAEYYSYDGEFPLAQIAQDYKLTLSQCYRIMQTQNGYWQQISKSPTIYRPSKKLTSLLNMFDLGVKNDNKTK